MNALSEWLKQQFNQRPRINQTSLAISIGTGQSTVSKWLQGLSIPTTDNCHKIARYFDVPEEEVLTMAGHLQPHVIGQHHVAEPRARYHTGPRARLDLLLDNLPDPQVEALITFLEALQ